MEASTLRYNVYVSRMKRGTVFKMGRSIYRLVDWGTDAIKVDGKEVKFDLMVVKVVKTGRYKVIEIIDKVDMKIDIID